MGTCVCVLFGHGGGDEMGIAATVRICIVMENGKVMNRGCISTRVVF
jgi:hypothetical protein